MQSLSLPAQVHMICDGRDAQVDLRIATRITRFHCIQGFDGFQNAVDCVAIILKMRDAFIESAAALLEGCKIEEVFPLAHLCYPRSSVNDSVFGAACVIKTIKALKRLIERGALPKPQRSIRLLFMPEFTGAYNCLWGNWDRLAISWSALIWTWRRVAWITAQDLLLA